MGLKANFTLLLVLLMAPLSAQAQLLWLVLPRQTLSRAELSADGLELLLAVHRKLEESVFGSAVARLGTLVDSTTIGYDSALIRFSKPMLIPARDLAAGRIALAAAPSLDTPDEARLRIAEAANVAKDGKSDEALRKIRHEISKNPNDIDSLLVHAGIAAQSGRWREALASYDRARALLPDASDLEDARHHLRRRFGPSISVDSSVISGPHGERDIVVDLRSELPVVPGWRLKTSVKSQDSTVSSLRRSGQDTATAYHGAKSQISAGLVREWESGSRTEIDAIAARSGPGGGFEHRFATSIGQTVVSLALRQPYWGTLMAFGADAQTDRVGVSQSASLGPGWSFEMSVGGVNYGVPRDRTVSNGVYVAGALKWAIPAALIDLAGWQPNVGYRLDAEYLSTPASGQTASGSILKLLDTRSREIHAIEASIDGHVAGVASTFLLGYAYDRYGGGGVEVQVRASNTTDAGAPLSFGLEAGMSPSLDRRSGTLVRLGAFAVWRFGT